MILRWLKKWFNKEQPKETPIQEEKPFYKQMSYEGRLGYMHEGIDQIKEYLSRQLILLNRYRDDPSTRISHEYLDFIDELMVDAMSKRGLSLWQKDYAIDYLSKHVIEITPEMRIPALTSVMLHLHAVWTTNTDKEDLEDLAKHYTMPNRLNRRSTSASTVHQPIEENGCGIVTTIAAVSILNNQDEEKVSTPSKDSTYSPSNDSYTESNSNPSYSTSSDSSSSGD